MIFTLDHPQRVAIAADVHYCQLSLQMIATDVIITVSNVHENMEL